MFYNEQWQCVAEHIYDAWSSGSPGSVDRWAYSIYGFQHIDEVLARVYHGGISAKTYYLLHDPQFSPVVVLEDNGRLSERIDYWANGFPRHHHMGDVDGDGDRGTDDQGYINTLANPTPTSITSSSYHAEADINRDGTINSTDYGFVSSATFTALPLGRLSDNKVYNNAGYSGYRYEAITKLYQVRFREFDPFRGRWLQRDPAGYMDSNNLYGYIAGNPIGWLDPFGLQGGGGAPINSADPTQFGSMLEHVIHGSIGSLWYTAVGINVNINGDSYLAIGRSVDRSMLKSTSTMFLYDPGNHSKHWRLDYGPIPMNSGHYQPGNLWHHNQNGMIGRGAIPGSYQNHAPTSALGGAAGWMTRGVRVLGLVGTTLGLYNSVNNILNSDNRWGTTLREAGGWGGSLAGAWLGAKIGGKIGAFFGPIGIGVGAIVGGGIGAIFGGHFGQGVTTSGGPYNNSIDNFLWRLGLIGRSMAN